MNLRQWGQWRLIGSKKGYLRTTSGDFSQTDVKDNGGRYQRRTLTGCSKKESKCLLSEYVHTGEHIRTCRVYM